MLRVKVKGLDKTFKDASRQVSLEANAILRAQAFQLYSHLKLVTPVDTGRARNSWYISYTPAQFKDAAVIPPPATPSLVVNNEVQPQSIYITNGVPYIEDLNNGSSKQASARFIETTTSLYF